MFQVYNGEVPWVSAIKCASSTMKNKIISSEDDLIGVVFYNTAKGRNQANFKGIYVLQKLDIPDAERIRELDILARDAAMFHESIGSASEAVIMGNVFWSCSSAFGPLYPNCAVVCGYTDSFVGEAKLGLNVSFCSPTMTAHTQIM
jgi:ATP-dependent DNA helicase 2 subunit 1